MQSAAVQVDSGSSPVGATAISWHFDGVSQARRRKQAFIARAQNGIAQLCTFLGIGDVGVNIVGSELLARERRGSRRKRLRGPRLLAWHIRFRNGALLDGPDRLPRNAIEYKHEALLRGLCDSIDKPSVVTD